MDVAPGKNTQNFDKRGPMSIPDSRVPRWIVIGSLYCHALVKKPNVLNLNIFCVSVSFCMFPCSK